MHQETKWFPSMSHDLHRLQAANVEFQDRLTTQASNCAALEAKLEQHRQKIDILQAATENVTRASKAAIADTNAAWTRCVRLEQDLNAYKSNTVAAIQRTQDELTKTLFMFHDLVGTPQPSAWTDPLQHPPQQPQQHPPAQPPSNQQQQPPMGGVGDDSPWQVIQTLERHQQRLNLITRAFLQKTPQGIDYQLYRHLRPPVALWPIDTP